MPDTNAPIDDAICHATARTLRTDDRVDRAVYVLGEGTDEHTHLAVALDATRYPKFVRDVRLELQWYRNDGFDVHYAETHADDAGGEWDDWQCRWDRQSSGHSAREHFHPPPDAGEPTDASFQNDYRSVVSMVLAAIRARIDELWRDDERTK